MIASIEHLTTVVSAAPPFFRTSVETDTSNLSFHIVLRSSNAVLGDGQEFQLRRYITGFVRQAGGSLRAFGFAPGRVHLLVGLPLFVAPGNFIRELKLLSAAYVVKKLGVSGFGWDGRTDAFTVSHSQTERVADYIFRQQMLNEPEDFGESWNRLASRELI